MRPLIAVDIETTGLDPTIHRILEVGLVSDTGSFAFSLPFDKLEYNGVPNWTQEALDINGWGKRTFAHQLLAPDAADRLHSLLYGAHLVGKSVHFDAAFLQVFLQRHGFEPSWHHRLVDVGTLTWGWDAAQGGRSGEWTTPPNVQNVEDLTGIKRDTINGYHTAAMDALWAHRVLRYILPTAP